VPITSLKFRPGINKETTSYSNKGGWNDCDKVRFRFGYPEKLGGWEKYANSTFLGTSRSLHTWANLEGNKYLGIGTELKFYIEESQTYRDITPIRRKVVGDEVILSLNTETVAFAVTGFAGTTSLGTPPLINAQSNDTLAPATPTGVSATGSVGTVSIEIVNPTSPATGQVGEVTVLVPTNVTVTDFVDES
jgi:hypothetical protein|tara:strand:- start:369 stop:941 length:573 start_codon:yes stop_codon:yes gene_type:complete